MTLRGLVCHHLPGVEGGVLAGLLRVLHHHQPHVVTLHQEVLQSAGRGSFTNEHKHMITRQYETRSNGPKSWLQ